MTRFSGLGYPRLEDLRAPRRALGAEERVRAVDRPARQLLDPARLAELREREAAEVRGREVCDVEAEVGLRVRARPVEGPAARVRGDEVVADVEHEAAVALVGTGGERGPDVEEPQPERVADGVLQAPRL